MKQEGNDIPAFTAADIRRYLDGAMTPAEMHALETASLEDPLLADALEGQQVSPEQFPAGVESLQRRLAARVAVPKRRTILAFPWPRVAAAVVVLLSLAGAGYLLLRDDRAARIAAQPAPVASDASRQEPKHVLPASDSSALSRNDQPSGAVAPAPDEMGPAKDRQSKGLAAGGATRNRENAPLDSRRRSLTFKKESAFARAQRAATTPANSDVPPIARNSVAAPAQLTPRKTDAAPPPSPEPEKIAESQETADVSVATAPSAPDSVAGRLSGKVAGLQTMAVPNRKAKAADRRIAETPAAGQQTGETAADSTGLGAPTALNDVVVVGYGRSRHKQVRGAEPAGGWLAFRQYLEAKKTDSSIDKNIHGLERVDFSVGKKGRLAEFGVVQSLSPAHDSLLIRLIQAGPEWKPGKKRGEKVIVRLPF